MAETDTLNVATETVDTDLTTVSNQPESTEVENAEIARLRAELAKAKAATDKATKEAGDAKKQLRARQSAEEIAAEEKRAQDEERDRKLAEYEKRFFVAETSKKVMKFVGDETASDSIAEFLFGAADVDGAIDAINKAWIAREKALRLEFGKIPSPGVGGGDGPIITKAELDKMSYKQRVEFSDKYPDEYEHLMGRK